MKPLLIAIAALTAFDAGAYNGLYRRHVIHECVEAVHLVTDQDWTSGPLA
jgi:hypothetical protein